MELPKVVTILGREYKLIIRENLRDDDGNVAGALLDVNSLEILIDPTVPPHRFWPALYHEVLHIALDVSGLDQRLSEEIVEIICQSGGNSFYDLVVSVGKPKRKKRCPRK